MSDGFKLSIDGSKELSDALIALAPNLRKGTARRALVAGAAPVLAAAIAATPSLSADVFKRGKMIRRAGTLRRSLKIRTSRDATRNGDVGVFINFKPLTKGAVSDFKQSTGRRGADNPDDNYYWRWVIFATKRNKNPSRSLQKAGDVMQSSSLDLISAYLKNYFANLASKASK